MSVPDALFSFSLAAILLTLTPGLDTALILRTASLEGRRKAFFAALGIDVGCFIWATAIAFGLGALLAVSELGYSIVKWCGAVYLCWLGIGLIINSVRQSNTVSSPPPSANGGFLRGMLCNVLNPKVGIFYISFLPQFIPTGHSPFLWTFILVGIHVFFGTLWSIILILASHFARKILAQPPIARWMERITGGVFLLFAANLALSKR